MAVVIPAEGGDAIARADAERLEGGSESPRAAQALGVGRAVERAVRAAAHDGPVAVQRLRPAHDGAEREGVVHGQAEHGPPTVIPSAARDLVRDARAIP